MDLGEYLPTFCGGGLLLVELEMSQLDGFNHACLYVYFIDDFYVQPEKPSILGLQIFFNWAGSTNCGTK